MALLVFVVILEANKFLSLKFLVVLMSCRVICLAPTKTFHIELRLELNGRIFFVRPKLSQLIFDIVENLLFFNLFFSQKLFDMD